MRKLFFLTSVGSLFIVLFLGTGCNKKVKVTDNAVTFDSISIAETYYMCSDSQKPSCNLQVRFLYPKAYEDPQMLTKIQSLFIEKFFGEEYMGMAPDAAAQRYKTQYIDEFKQFEKRFGERDSLEANDESDETGHSYYTTIKNAVLFNKNNLISFTVEYSNYTGGAHGSHSIYGYVIDLESGTLVSEDQIFVDNYKKALAAIIVDQIANANHLKDPKELENIGYGSIEDIVPNGNIVFDEAGITYFFNENEIAAYVMGITKVFLPYEEVNLYLKKDSPVSRLTGI